jgi:hypothetical protein
MPPPMMATSLSASFRWSSLVLVESVQPPVPLLCDLTLPDLPSSLWLVHITASNGLRDRYERYEGRYQYALAGGEDQFENQKVPKRNIPGAEVRENHQHDRRQDCHAYYADQKRSHQSSLGHPVAEHCAFEEANSALAYLPPCNARYRQAGEKRNQHSRYDGVDD